MDKKATCSHIAIVVQRILLMQGAESKFWILEVTCAECGQEGETYQLTSFFIPDIKWKKRKEKDKEEE